LTPPLFWVFLFLARILPSYASPANLISILGPSSGPIAHTLAFPHGWFQGIFLFSVRKPLINRTTSIWRSWKHSEPVKS
jgi:hypothetical protein